MIVRVGHIAANAAMRGRIRWSDDAAARIGQLADHTLNVRLLGTLCANGNPPGDDSPERFMSVSSADFSNVPSTKPFIC